MELLRKLFLPITVPMKFIQDHFKAMIFILIVVLIFAPANNEGLTQHNLQSIKLVGPIMEVSEVLEQIEKAHKDDSIKGVLLVVNSPGGAVAPSVEIAYAIKRLKETAIAGNPKNRPSVAAAIVPEYKTSSPILAPALIPDITTSGGLSNKPVIPMCTQSVGVPFKK